MDDSWLWAFGASWTGISFSVIAWYDGLFRGDTAAPKIYGITFFAFTILSLILVILMGLVEPADVRHDIAAVGGVAVGIVAGVYTRFGTMGPESPTGPTP